MCPVSFKPTVSGWNKVLGAYGRLHDADAAKQTETFWRNWQLRYETEVVDVPPNEISTMILMDAWSDATRHDRAAGDRAWAFLQQVESRFMLDQLKTRPDARAYARLILIYGKLRDTQSAEQIFDCVWHACSRKYSFDTQY